jgi:hypothetical protein
MRNSGSKDSDRAPHAGIRDEEAGNRKVIGLLSLTRGKCPKPYIEKYAIKKGLFG